MPKLHTCFQTPQMARKPQTTQMACKPHVFNIWSNASLSYRNISLPHHPALCRPHLPWLLSSILIPFRFPAFNNQPCTCSSDHPSSSCWLCMWDTAPCWVSSPPLSCIHGRHSDSLWATDPQETLQEAPGLRACTSDPSWGPGGEP